MWCYVFVCDLQPAEWSTGPEAESSDRPVGSGRLWSSATRQNQHRNGDGKNVIEFSLLIFHIYILIICMSFTILFVCIVFNLLFAHFFSLVVRPRDIELMVFCKRKHSLSYNR